jgi:hypothetical protein
MLLRDACGRRSKEMLLRDAVCTNRKSAEAVETALRQEKCAVRCSVKLGRTLRASGYCVRQAARRRAS